LNQYIDTLNELINTSLFEIGKTEFTISSISYLILMFALLFFLSNRIKRWILNRIDKTSRLNKGSFRSIAKIVHYVSVIIGSAIILQTSGFDLGAFTMIAGAVGIGLGFGLQTIVNNFFSGIIILFERPIKVGDRIEVGNVEGDVRDISIRATTVVTNDNIAIIVPNSEFISSTVVNWSFTDNNVRFKFKVGTSYNSDPHLVREILLEVAKAHKGILQNPPPTVRFDSFGDSSLDFVLIAWTQDYCHRPGALRSEINFAIWDAFKEHNIEIPFPQRDVHIKSQIK
jgi:small-conductance mechanosensitive channel